MYDELVYRINGGYYTVYNALKPIWNEEVYEQALEIELQERGLKVERQKEFEVFYFDQRVGHYRIDLLVEDAIILELKAVPEVFPLYQAQLISYLKGYNKPLGILMNFGDRTPHYQIFPNKVSQKTVLRDEFDFEKVQMKDKEFFKTLLVMANRILVTLGPGYFHQVYRRAFYYELKTGGIEFELIKNITARFREHELGSKEVLFFRIGDVLLSAMAVQELTSLGLAKFRNYIEHFHCQKGLFVNFNALRLDFRYLEL